MIFFLLMLAHFLLFSQSIPLTQYPNNDMLVFSMLTHAQLKLIRSLHTKKGRKESGRCLVEGQKVIDTAGDAIEYTFAATDTDEFDTLVTTETPQDRAAVARIPQWNMEEITALPTVVVLDGVQDPGNVGAIFRLCLGFRASLILIESTDPTNPKVLRSSVGALFQVPWIQRSRAEAIQWLDSTSTPLFRLEQSGNARTIDELRSPSPLILIAGSEGNGITLPAVGTSVTIAHDAHLESLNVGHAVAIALAHRFASL